jgi:hypothetical protein
MGMGTYEEAHELVMSAYAAKYNMAPLFWKKPHVKHADAMLYRTEARDFRQPGTWHDPTLTGPTLPYRLQASTPQDAERQFLERFVELCVATGRIEAANEGMLALEQLAPREHGAIEQLVDYAFDKVVAVGLGVASVAIAIAARQQNRQFRSVT